jgi:phosphate/sulfate permease
VGSYGGDGTYYSPGDRPESEGKAHGVKDVVGLTTGYAGIVVGGLFGGPTVGTVVGTGIGKFAAAPGISQVVSAYMCFGLQNWL